MKREEFLKAVEIISKSSKNVRFISSYEVTRVNDEGLPCRCWKLTLTHSYRDIIVDLIAAGYDIEATLEGVKIYYAPED